jgi:hypothetical protein
MMEMVMNATAATMNPLPSTARIPLMMPTAEALAAFLMAR